MRKTRKTRIIAIFEAIGPSLEIHESVTSKRRLNHLCRSVARAHKAWIDRHYPKPKSRKASLRPEYIDALRGLRMVVSITHIENPKKS